MALESCCAWLSSWPVLLLLLLTAAYLTYMSWHFRHFYRQGVPMVGTPLPVLGTALQLFTQGLIQSTDGMIEKHGKTFGGFSGRLPALTTVDAEIIRQVFIKDHASFPNRFNLQSGNELDDNMLQNVCDYAHWKSLRSTMSPAFSSGKLKRMLKQINKCASIYAGHLVRESGDGDKVLEMKDFAGSFTMDVIASTAFGLDVNSQEDRNNPFVRNAMKSFDIKLTHPLILTALFCPFLQPVMRYFKFSFFNADSQEFFRDITNQVLDSRMDEKDDGHVDFLQLMMNAHKESDPDSDGGKSTKRALTRQEILSQAVLFFMAGYDTTATTISFLAYILACNPDEQDKLIEEVREIVGEEVSDEDLHKMPYLDMCVSESLRLFPPAARIDRIADKDVVVKGIQMPKGSMVGVPVYHMHRLAEYYPDPEAFIPERFSVAEKAKRDPLLYMPFGAGPRQCLATRLALLEVKIAIAHVLKTHRFVRAPETQVPAKFSMGIGLLKMENGIWVLLEKHSRAEQLEQYI